MITAYEQASELAAAGRYTDALKILDGSRVAPPLRVASDVLRLELLERIRPRQQLRDSLDTLLSSKLLPHERSRCEIVLGRMDREAGDRLTAIEHFQRAVAAATQIESSDPKAKAWSLIALVLAVADNSGPDATAPILADLRSVLSKCGSAQLWAALHMCGASLDARRGLLRNAKRHTRIGYSLLAREPHLWIETHLHIVDFGVAMKSREFATALSHARYGVELAELSGASGLQRNCFGNLAYVLCALGKYDEALAAFERSTNILPSLGTNSAAVLETAARVRLAQGRLDDCEQLLCRIDEMIRTQNDRFSYGHREAALTKAKLLASKGLYASAIAQCDNVSSLADRVKDDWLRAQSLFSQAEFMVRLERQTDALALIDDAVSRLLEEPVDLFAQYERLLGAALNINTDSPLASAHFERAKRVYIGTHDVPELSEVTRQYTRCDPPAPTASSQSAASLLHDVVAALVHTSRPELLACEVARLLTTTGGAYRAAAVASMVERPEETLGTYEAEFNQDACAGSFAVAERTVAVGACAGRSIEIKYLPKPGIESVATINSIRLLLAAAQELDRGRAEREQTLTLWPVDDEAPSEDGFILLGTMAKLMTQAKRVAKANITVLITGESGTGKEVLARAVHKYSDRAAKPFVPFNCAAIPRDLVESHLFGHRRGAFTGADRDQPGIIRGARGGTIFLDEVGELSLDLQPKLLRFLESGEIAPLGEPGPSHVDVRVVAATNAKLETAVSEGRFREDLFYRLNVVRLDIPPLRERRDEIGALVNHFVTATALEFRKGFVRLAEETMEHFLVHRWPGNVRQLQNEVRRIVALADADSVIPPTVLAPEILNRHLLAPPPSAGGDLAIPVRDKLLPTLWRIEREMIKVALRDNGGRVEAAAKALGISRKGLYLKRQRLGL